MFNLNKFIADSVTFRPVSMFAADIEANKDKLSTEIKGKKVCVMGGAGSTILCDVNKFPVLYPLF